jgi:hypothetical protein
MTHTIAAFVTILLTPAILARALIEPAGVAAPLGGEIDSRLSPYSSSPYLSTNLAQIRVDMLLSA